MNESTFCPTETNPLGPNGHPDIPVRVEHGATHQYTLCWDDPKLARVTRLRLLSDPGLDFWDVSYCHGEDSQGVPCRVALPFDQLKRRTGRRMPMTGEFVSNNAPSLKRQIVEYAIEDGINAKRLGILDAISTLY